MTATSEGIPNRRRGARVIVLVPTHLERLDEALAATLLHNAIQLKDYKLEVVMPQSCDSSWFEAFFSEHAIQGTVRRVPSKYFGSTTAVNKMGTDPEFYSMYRNYEYILICHLDAWVFRDTVADWMDAGYDFVGAPLFLPRNHRFHFARAMAPFGCNGGLSLRRVESCIRILEDFRPGISPRYLALAFVFLARNRQWGLIRVLVRLMRELLRDWRATCEKYNIYEDVFFTVIAPLCGTSISIPTGWTASRFACEVNYPLIQKEIFKLDSPLGIHGYDKYIDSDYLNFVRGFFARKQAHYDSEDRSTRPVVSVVMIVKNLIASRRTETFDQAITSVLNQSYEAVEIVLLDGASTDGTFGLLRERYGHHKQIAFHCKADSSVWEGMSNGVALAKGELIAVMNSDDYFCSPESLKAMVSRIIESNADMAYGGTLLLTQRGSMRFPTHLPSTLYCFGVVHQATLIRKSVIESIQPFNGDHVTAENYLFLAILMAGFKTVEVPGILVHYRVGGISSDLYGGVNAERTVTDYVRYMKKLTTIGHYLSDAEIRQLHGFSGISQQGPWRFLRMVWRIRDRRLRSYLLAGVWNLVRWKGPILVKSFIVPVWRRIFRKRVSRDGMSG